MTGKIIDFRSHHQLKSARLDYREPAPRSRAKRPARRSGAKANVDQQIAHIAWLLRELEDIARGGEDLPQVVVAQAHASIKKTRTMLQSWPAIGFDGKTDAIKDGTQPNIDPALLDRMYRDLGVHP